VFDSDVIANDRQTKRNNDRLDKQALQGESNGGRSDRNSRSNQGDDSIAEIFTTPEGEVYGFVDKEGNIYLDETVISPEHPIHEYTHLWDRVVAEIYLKESLLSGLLSRFFKKFCEKFCQSNKKQYFCTSKRERDVAQPG
jgi:hypothetical protein